MRLATFDKRLEPKLRALAHALARLDAAQGKIARRNARAAIKTAQNAMQAKVDTLYPTGPRKVPKKRRKLTPRQRLRKLEKGGWEQVTSQGVLSRIAAAGIKVLRVSGRHPGHTADWTNTMAPNWAIQIASLRPSKLVACKRDIKLRRALLVELALEEDEESKRRTA